MTLRTAGNTHPPADETAHQPGISPVTARRLMPPTVLGGDALGRRRRARAIAAQKQGRRRLWRNAVP
jgi:hypothetical protein